MTNLRRAMIAVAALCMLPMAAVLVSAVLAALLSCELNEGGTTACIVLGADFGGFLSGLSHSAGWRYSPCRCSWASWCCGRV